MVKLVGRPDADVTRVLEPFDLSRFNIEPRFAGAIAALMRFAPWAPAAERGILNLADWLATRPPPIALKARCQAVLKALD